jgi:hypothetical protein
VSIQRGEALIAEVTSKISEDIFSVFDIAVRKAEKKAPTTSAKWGAKKGGGGLHPSTYRAVIKRYGHWENENRVHNFNGELTRPIIAQITEGWQRVFERILPACISQGSITCVETLSEFRVGSSQYLSGQGISTQVLQQLDAQFPRYTKTFQKSLYDMQNYILQEAKSGHRQFAKVVADIMYDVYTQCQAEQGIGSYGRMKEIMRDHIDVSKTSMFKKSAKLVHGVLDNAIERAAQIFLGQIHTFNANVMKSYHTVWENNAAVISKEQKDLRRSIVNVISTREPDLIQNSKTQQTRTEHIKTDYADKEIPNLVSRNKLVRSAAGANVDIMTASDHASKAEDEMNVDINQISGAYP